MENMEQILENALDVDIAEMEARTEWFEREFPNQYDYSEKALYEDGIIAVTHKKYGHEIQIERNINNEFLIKFIIQGLAFVMLTVKETFVECIQFIKEHEYLLKARPEEIMHPDGVVRPCLYLDLDSED